MLDADEEAGVLPASEEKTLVEHKDMQMLEADKVKQLEDRLLRLAADFDNYKKRAVKENDTLKELSVAETMRKILPIVDDFEIAISHMKISKDKEFKHGMELIYAKLLDLLKREGIEEMKVLGKSFDPYAHEAIRYEKGKEGEILEIVQKGYLFKGKVLRYAKVIVGKEEEKC
ncbi:nucleotide exchange factor GrpE [Candidatus Micrarchaeota archaeon]|nr:nucleotide exchange factor GrpE [Candidatus Micrarchaeota archaeon]